MKRLSVILFVVAILMIGTALAREGFGSLWPKGTTPAAIPVASINYSLRLVLEAEGVGADGGKVSVIVNGRAVTTFAAGPVTLLVNDQDEIQIDSDLLHKIRVKVRETAAEIVLPRAGDDIQVQNTVETLGRVIIRKRNG